ncbi:MAG: hypothetical protein FWE31_02440 [Firmicutes bacterium]|nr:hypothetical protein [Bacillota bacterium]
MDALDGKVTIDGASVFSATAVHNSDLALILDLSSYRHGAIPTIFCEIEGV